MKIAFLTHEPFYPPSGGGSAEALYIVQEFVRRGHEVHVFCPKLAEPESVEQRFSIKLHQFEKWEMGRYTSLRNFKYLAFPFFLLRMVEQAARRIDFDLIFSEHAIAAVAAGWLKQRLHLPVVMNFLDYLTGFMETWPPYLAPPPLLHLLKRYELSIPRRCHAEAVLTVSDTLADYFANSGYPRDKILPIYYGYDADLFPFRGRPAKDQEQPVLVMHGSLDHHHLQTIALEAWIRVLADKPKAVLRIIGHKTPALAQFLKKASERAPQGRIETTGFIPYAEVAPWLSSSTIGIVPYEESVGTHCAFVAKIVEYLAVGLPAVSTPLESARRYFGNEPRVDFSQFDGRDFGERILKRIAKPSEPEAAQAASERVRRELDWRAISRNAVQFSERAAAATKETRAK